MATLSNGREVTISCGWVFRAFDVTAEESLRMWPLLADRIKKGWEIGEPTDAGRLNYWAVPIEEAVRAWPDLAAHLRAARREPKTGPQTPWAKGCRPLFRRLLDGQS